jgi:MYXO-CTERM domain-containing protein
MRSAVLAGVLTLVSGVAAAGPISAPILGGTKATVGQYPSVVAIELSTSQGTALCTGTLVTDQWILTAAHCVQGIAPSKIKVHFNTVDAFRVAGKVVGATQAIAKPSFSIDTLGANDIGLIQLSEKVTDIKPVPVNLDPTKAPVGVKVTMVGFGATAQGGGGSIGVEYVVEQTSVACNGAAGSDANLLCFNQVSGKGKCEGDSGGPSFAMIDNHLVQVGITSFGDQNCAQFGADTRVDAEVAFIKQYIPQLHCEMDTDCGGTSECFLGTCIAQPFGPGGVGATCTGNGDCDSQLCAQAGDQSLCTMSCTAGDNSTCPAGLECVDGGACWPPEDSGCCSASGKGAPTMLFGIALVGLVWRRRRK